MIQSEEELPLPHCPAERVTPLSMNMVQFATPPEMTPENSSKRNSRGRGNTEQSEQSHLLLRVPKCLAQSLDQVLALCGEKKKRESAMGGKLKSKTLITPLV